MTHDGPAAHRAKTDHWRPKWTSTQRTVISLRFGFDGGEPLLLKEIGERIGVTRERARQIEGEALAKIRRHAARELR